jgi:hypothetical protein
LLQHEIVEAALVAREEDGNVGGAVTVGVEDQPAAIAIVLDFEHRLAGRSTEPVDEYEGLVAGRGDVGVDARQVDGVPALQVPDVVRVIETGIERTVRPSTVRTARSLE